MIVSTRSENWAKKNRSAPGPPVSVSLPGPPFSVLSSELPVMTLSAALPVALIDPAPAARTRCSKFVPSVKLIEATTVSVPALGCSKTTSPA